MVVLTWEIILPPLDLHLPIGLCLTNIDLVFKLLKMSTKNFDVISSFDKNMNVIQVFVVPAQCAVRAVLGSVSVS